MRADEADYDGEKDEIDAASRKPSEFQMKRPLGQMSPIL
jgi:hypothetical protein